MSVGVGMPRALAAEAIVTDVRVGKHPTTTRFVVDLTSRVKFKVFTLANPPRVVVDMPEVGWRLPARPLPARIGLLKQLRYGLFKRGTSRVVMDINEPAVVENAFLMRAPSGTGFRMVVDLVKTTREAFLKNTRGPALSVASVQKESKRKTGFLTPPMMPAKPAAAPVKLKSIAPVASVAPPRKPNRGAKKRIVVLDPGHGGVDPGTRGISGTYEKHITLAAARAMKERLEKSGRFHVVVTRNRDIFVPLRERVAIAREAGAALFISIHADAIKNRNIQGPSVYTLSEKASDKEAEALAEKENKVDLIAGIDLNNQPPEVANILIDLTQRETMNQSARFASNLVRELRRETKLLRNTHRFAGFAVLKAPDVPSVLLELGFLSNPREERALRRHSYRGKLASAVARAIDKYFERVEEANRK